MKAGIIVSLGLACGAIASQHARRATPDLIQVLSTVANEPLEIGEDTAASVSDLVSQLQHGTDSTTPGSDQSALSSIKQAMSGASSIVDAANAITAAGLIPSQIASFLNGYLDTELNSRNNSNPAVKQNIYPNKAAADAPYSVPESTLRAAIHIPDSFSFGRNGNTPVILVPGTAIPAGTTYYYSFSKLANSSAGIDVVWVNMPRASLSDAQVNAEYVAYAINYISALSAGQSVGVISWSQGGLDTQWALKYWPSTRPVVADFVAISPDFHGTVEANFLCPALDYSACTPSIFQQEWTAQFIQVLRADDGDSAYVPTTTVYSSSDEIVEPQSGGSNASAFLRDARGVGVTNAHLQTVCADKPAGGFYTHEGVLYNPLAWALAADAISHQGPANLARIDLASVCQQAVPPALGLDDVLGTEGLLLVAVAEILAYQPRATSEPPVKAYAKQNHTVVG
ncbi:hypothetical protein N7474_003051 [Penicillium riverlandense]|uniref:uncharacterized protein n=1 Tax=Penicillium riverlandense TaxID=1903569 RepID=UPI002548B0A1|nr:uncharacterized protein N7474_003051 [Penicillium riverlandense]KAJ5825913.1 hypothetical protein N7474_003051 [Penicillium riverlandense]